MCQPILGLYKIADHIENTSINIDLDNEWVDSNAICTYWGICDRTLYRLRKIGDLPYSVLSGKIYYTIGDIKKLLAEKKFKSKHPIDNLIEHHSKCLKKGIINRNLTK